jgi:hypothetical protein
MFPTIPIMCTPNIGAIPLFHLLQATCFEYIPIQTNGWTSEMPIHHLIVKFDLVPGVNRSSSASLSLSLSP